MTNEVETTPEATLEDKKNEARVKDLMARITNKTKREVVRYFDERFEDLDDLDTIVMLAYVACEKSRTLEDLDDTAFEELNKIVLGE